jgi:hypothetical protein
MSSRKMPPEGVTGTVLVKHLWPKNVVKRSFPAVRDHDTSCKFAITGKRTALVSANKEAVCYVGTVAECKQ